MSRKETMKIIDDMVRKHMLTVDASEAEAIVCMPADQGEAFEDDLFGECKGCGVKVRYRPYMPNLPKLCMECAGLLIKLEDGP